MSSELVGILINPPTSSSLSNIKNLGFRQRN